MGNGIGGFDVNGLPYPGRNPDAPSIAPGGPARTSAFYAPLAQVTNGEIVNSVFDPAAGAIPLFLFLQDAPTNLLALLEYLAVQLAVAGGGGGTVTIAALPDFAPVTLVGGQAAPLTTVLAAASVTPAGGANIGKRVRANTLTNALRVWGFAAQIGIVDRGYDDAGGAEEPTVRLYGLSQAAIQDGRGNGNIIEYDGANTVNPIGGAVYPNQGAVILREEDYTAAIKAAKNTHVSATGRRTKVVGLHAIPEAG